MLVSGKYNGVGYIIDIENNQKIIRSHPKAKILPESKGYSRFGHIGEPGLVGLQNLSAQN